VRVADDRFDLIVPRRDRFRVLQVTDTHFGRPNEADAEKDKQSAATIRALIEEHEPDLVFHTGDFINNDVLGATYGGVDVMNDLGRPWALVWGNHDYPRREGGGLTLDEFHARLGGGLMGHATIGDKKEFCYRIDVRGETGGPQASLFCFDTGGGRPHKHVSDAQLEWFGRQLEADKEGTPIVVMQHIPTLDYHTMRQAGGTVGRKGEDVCFETDTGEVFRRYRDSGRVRAVLCGHDHVNDYLGDHQGVHLIYGRVSGWAGYGDWQRGGRLLDCDLDQGRFTTRVVLPTGKRDNAYFSKTLEESRFPAP
jgi:3',5'-cyclic AMP phosphodiesterase CpdA